MSMGTPSPAVFTQSLQKIIDKSGLSVYQPQAVAEWWGLRGADFVKCEQDETAML
jgi:hypothetical protein